MLLMKGNKTKLSKVSLDTTDQALLELLRKEDKNNMEIPDTDFSFTNSIVPILQSFPTKVTCKIRSTAGLNGIQI